MGTITARYDASAERYRAWWEPVLAAAALAILDRAEPASIDGDTARILDVGTGAGLLAIEAVERWPTTRVVGVDASTGMLGVAARQADARLGPADRARLELLAGDAGRLPFPTASFDLVLSSFVLQLVADRGAALREIHRVLRPGGRLVTVTWLLGPDEPFEPDEAFEDALDAIGYDDDGEAEEARSGDFVSATAAAAQFRRAGFRDVRADARVLVHRHDRSTYLDFLELYAESELFEDLEPDVRRRLRAETAARLGRLPEAAFEWRAPVVEVIGRRP